MKFAALPSSRTALLVLLLSLLTAELCFAQIALPKLPQGVGVCVVDLEKHQLVASHETDALLKPASIQKLILSAAALEELGPEFKFYTDVAVVGRRGSAVDALYIVGGGDPSMTTERLWLLARQIHGLGIREIRSLEFDDSAFAGAKSRDGQRAYLTGSSALSLNFNSITIKACPTLPGEKAALSADPWESGALLNGEVRTVVRGGQGVAADSKSDANPHFQVSGRIDAAGNCSEVYRSVPNPERYFAQTLSGFLKYLGISVPKSFGSSVVPASADVVIHFPSLPLSQILRDMNLYSSNFIAEQVLSALGGAGEAKPHFSRELGLTRLKRYLGRVAEPQAVSEVFDGSGLSHDNRVRTKSFCSVLDRMDSNFALATEFLASLPVSGVNGTLRRRDFDLPTKAIRAKTGSLNGVSSLAGYLVTNSGKRLGFAIVQNRSVDKFQAMQLEDNLVRVLVRG